MIELNDVSTGSYFWIKFSRSTFCRSSSPINARFWISSSVLRVQRGSASISLNRSARAWNSARLVDLRNLVFFLFDLWFQLEDALLQTDHHILLFDRENLRCSRSFFLKEVSYCCGNLIGIISIGDRSSECSTEITILKMTVQSILISSRMLATFVGS